MLVYYYTLRWSWMGLIHTKNQSKVVVEVRGCRCIWLMRPQIIFKIILSDTSIHFFFYFLYSTFHQCWLLRSFFLLLFQTFLCGGAGGQRKERMGEGWMIRANSSLNILYSGNLLIINAKELGKIWDYTV